MTSRAVLRVGAQWVVASVAVWVATPPQRVTPLRVVVVGGFLLVAVHVVARVSGAARAEPVLRVVPVELAPPGELRVRLARLETALTYASGSAAHFDRTVRPALCALVADRLLRRRGVDLGTSPAAARAIIGEELWQLIQTVPARPGDAPGPSPAELDRLVALVEAV
ncbi:MAG TPA: hypothetical protein VNA12_07885 [Mycobacteriales bacterium]|nr:hypothetical protein [Mycobacteriales bacterium]